MPTTGAVISSLNTRRGNIVNSEVREDEFTITAEVALNDMFGYSNALRGVTQGKGEFTMEYKVRHNLVYSVKSSCLQIINRTISQYCPMYKRTCLKHTRSPSLKPKSRATLRLSTT